MLLAAALRHELDNSVHTYDFVEGAIPAPLAPGMFVGRSPY